MQRVNELDASEAALKEELERVLIERHQEIALFEDKLAQIAQQFEENMQ